MKIVTFNLRYNWCNDGINSFIHRAGMIYDKIRSVRPDVIAFQEVTPKNFEFLSTMLSDIYELRVKYRSADFDGEGLALAFLKGAAEPVDIEGFWLSPTPNVPGSRFPIQSDCPRIALVALCRDLSSGRVVRICNTHLDHKSEEARELGAELLLSRMTEAREAFDADTVILGDMNARPDSRVVSMFLNSKLSLSDVTSGLDASFHGFVKKSVKIDYIFVTRGLKVKTEAKVWDDSHEGIYLSDHYPIEVDFE